MSKPLKVKKVSAADPVQQTAIRILRTRLKEFYSHWPDPQTMPTAVQLHNLRISGKRLRYSAEQLRELYGDRLALLIDLLKRSQDLLGEIQDCVTQRAVFEAEMPRLLRRKPKEAVMLERLMAESDDRQEILFVQFREIWQGMTMTEFRASLNAMIIAPSDKECIPKEGKAFPSNPIRE